VTFTEVDNYPLTFIIIIMIKKNKLQTSTLLVALIALPLLIVITESQDIISVYASPVTIFSTRGHFDITTGQENTAHRVPTAADLLRELNQRCPGEIAIYVHGVWASRQSAIEQVQRVDISLREGNNYDIPIVGFSWDSDTIQDRNGNGWEIAKVIANNNGKLLANLIVGYKGACPSDEVRLIGHSLGSRVILSALQSLHDESRGKIIRSVHLMGAAVDDEQVSTNDRPCLSNIPPLPCSGRAIESTVQTKLYNLHNPEDNMLDPVWVYKEDYALGLDGSIGSEPDNYEQYSVLYNIPPISNADGDPNTDCLDTYIGAWGWSEQWGPYWGWGDNHCGYMGFRTLPSSDPNKDGAIEDVVRDWRSNP
jgi:pimeloyl-ACP methyl ester carboxylesterase